jgi:hypothetical protein
MRPSWHYWQNCPVLYPLLRFAASLTIAIIATPGATAVVLLGGPWNACEDDDARLKVTACHVLA